MTKPGERVLAIRNADDKTVFVFGTGVYVGHERPPNGTLHPFGIVDDAFPADYTNPRIDLDNGKTVWGFQCWWGPEDATRRKFGDRLFVVVPLPGEEAARADQLNALLEAVRDHVMTDEEREAQRQSWVRGEMAIGLDEQEAAERKRLRDAHDYGDDSDCKKCGAYGPDETDPVCRGSGR